MNSLQTQKKLLIAESELSRVQILGDVVVLATGVRVILDRTKSWGTMASAAAVLLAGIATFRRRQKGHVAPPKSRLQSVLNGAGFIFSLWSALRPSPRAQTQRLPPEQPAGPTPDPIHPDGRPCSACPSTG